MVVDISQSGDAARFQEFLGAWTRELCQLLHRCLPPNFFYTLIVCAACLSLIGKHLLLLIPHDPQDQLRRHHIQPEGRLASSVMPAGSIGAVAGVHRHKKRLAKQREITARSFDDANYIIHEPPPTTEDASVVAPRGGVGRAKPPKPPGCCLIM